MTDHLKGLIVTLVDIREDDSEQIIEAIKMLRGVLDVRPLVANMDHHLAVTTARHQMRDKILKAVLE